MSWRQAYVQLTDASPVYGKELLGTEKLSVEDAKHRHLTLKQKLRARFSGFYYKQNCADDTTVDIKFLFGSVEFAPDEGYISHQVFNCVDTLHVMRNCTHVCSLLCCVVPFHDARASAALLIEICEAAGPLLGASSGCTA